MIINNAVKTAGTAPSAVLSSVQSILNWNLTAAEMNALEGADDREFEVISNSLSNSINKRRGVLGARKAAQINAYMVDETPMFVPNALSLSDEYFVVL